MMARGNKPLEPQEPPKPPGKVAPDGLPAGIFPDAFARMEQSILQGKLAVKICGHCGGMGHFEITQTRGDIRYLTCTACGIPKDRPQVYCVVVVTREEVLAAFAAPQPEVQLPQPAPSLGPGFPQSSAS